MSLSYVVGIIIILMSSLVDVLLEYKV